MWQLTTQILVAKMKGHNVPDSSHQVDSELLMGGVQHLGMLEPLLGNTAGLSYDNLNIF